MAVQYLKYRDKEYPIKLGHHSMRRFQDEHNAKLEDARENIGLYEHLLFYALKQGARVERQELDLEFDDMVDVLDDCQLAFMNAIPKFFPDDIPDDIKEEIEKLSELQEGEGKQKTKKQTGTKSKDKQSSN